MQRLVKEQREGKGRKEIEPDKFSVKKFVLLYVNTSTFDASDATVVIITIFRKSMSQRRKRSNERTGHYSSYEFSA